MRHLCNPSVTKEFFLLKYLYCGTVTNPLLRKFQELIYKCSQYRLYGSDYYK